MGTPVGDLNLSAILLMAIGGVVLFLSFMGGRLPYIRPKAFKAVGVVLVLLGVLYYAA